MRKKKIRGENSMGEARLPEGNPLIRAQMKQGWLRYSEDFTEWECKQIKVMLKTRQIIIKTFL
ncbi:MAG: hypothetical protein A3G93_10580 [Nitrospinae bacterium RIFCSPLOWO2_12_FULL_45_22]|jgi:hypothetical protein|nr:MAG: hypothetical protein A3G93_10580 [Nitrospinae bacterium RIFCSPLOWO2_12_FULL_45_22]